MLTTALDRLGDWNPQLLRELKGRLNKRNMAIAAAIALISQCFLLVIFGSNLPKEIDLAITQPTGGLNQFNRYCTASPPPDVYRHSHYANPYCITDLLGHWVINWQLWWFDIFRILSIIGMFVVLVAGTYLLINDLSKEESRGTLNFIRLSPRSADNILMGKLLGVPSLVYFLGLLALPLHLIAGWQAHIPIGLIFAFYGVLLASCAFFFNFALLFGLMNSGLGGFQAFLGSGLVLFFLFVMTGMMTYSSGTFIYNNPFDWITIFYPGTILSYLAESTFLPTNTIDFNYEDIHNLLWYGQSLWNNTWLGIGFLLVNYSLWTYWISQALKRRFHNPIATWLSKAQSYWLSVSFITMVLGFVFQIEQNRHFKYDIFDNFAILQMFILGFILLLIAALSPDRQPLQDWARYRHQTHHHHRSILADLVFGERSPSTVAITLNLGLIFLYLFPSIAITPLGSLKWWLVLGLFLGLNMVLMAGLVAQRILLMKTPKRNFLAMLGVTSLIILPPICFGILGLNPNDIMSPWLFSFFPLIILEHCAKLGTTSTIIFSILGQYLIITLTGLEMTKQLRKSGESETKALLKSEAVRVNS